jgi:hypothetical protein
VAGFQLYGSPKTIVEQVKRYRDAGVGVLDIAFAGEAFGRGGTKKAMEAFAEVIPEVQAL